MQITVFCRSLIESPITSFCLGLFLLVWQFKMTQNSANLTTVAIWGLFTLAVLRTPPVLGLEMIPRVLVTAMFSSMIGLGLYTTIWTNPVSATIPKSDAPPFTIVRMQVQHSDFEIGKNLQIVIDINNTLPGAKFRTRFYVLIGSGDDAALSTENRQKNEAGYWNRYEQDAFGKPPIPLSGTLGLMHFNIPGPLITEEIRRFLTGPTGIVYVVGQIDYGQGALDYGAYIRMDRPETAVLCVGHNGPSTSVAFIR